MPEIEADPNVVIHTNVFIGFSPRVRNVLSNGWWRRWRRRARDGSPLACAAGTTEDRSSTTCSSKATTPPEWFWRRSPWAGTLGRTQRSAGWRPVSRRWSARWNLVEQPNHQRRPREMMRMGSVIAVALAAVLQLTGCGVTSRPFTDAGGQVVAGSMATMEALPIGGVVQHVWFRGVHTHNPPLIILHGGPGASEAALFRHYNAALEQHYLVVYWEQRGAGRSYHDDIPASSMTVSRFVADLDELVRLVQARFGKQKVVLLGHSWGTVIGTLYAHDHPENVAAYIGIGQIADAVEGERLSYAFALQEAERRGDGRVIEEIRAIGPAPRSPSERLALSRRVEGFTVEAHGTRSTLQLILAALSTDEANLVDLVRFGQGNRFSLETLFDETSRVDLMRRVTRLKVPVVFMSGRHDWNVPAVLAAQYFERIEAPCKQLVWFEHSGHNPPFDEPERFDSVMNGEILSTVKRGCL